MNSDDLPAYSDLILPTVRAVSKMGGSATTREITTQVLEDLAPTDEMLAVARANRPEASVYLERVQWARSYAKLIGALDPEGLHRLCIAPAGCRWRCQVPELRTANFGRWSVSIAVAPGASPLSLQPPASTAALGNWAR